MRAAKTLGLVALGSALVLSGCDSRATNRGPGGNTTDDRGSPPPGGGNQNTPSDPGARVGPNTGGAPGPQGRPRTGTNPSRANPAGTTPTGRH